LRSSIRRNARRLSPSRPCQPSLAASRRSPPMDFTGYRKIASTCPISMSMLDPSPPNVRVDRTRYTPLVVARLVVHGQQVEPEIAVEVTPHGMNVVGAVLGVVVLDQKSRRLNAVIMRPAALLYARPGEEHAG